MAVLVDRSVPRTLFSMAYPMLAGTFAMNAYNLTDTWFVSRLGTLPLAAMGFTFPVVMFLTCVAMGIGAGVTTLASHAMGRNDAKDAARFVTHGIWLTIGVTAAISVAGYLLIDPVFTALGADSDTLPLVGEYMRTWYVGAVFMTLPMLGNGVLISAGDSRAASSRMILGTVLNAILDPVMIFGWFGCPAMGMRGAALATVISQAISTVWLFHLLVRKHRLLEWGVPSARDFLASMGSITRFAVPSILSMVLMPISGTVITKIISGFGSEAVAATAAAGRVEMFAFMVPMALGISLTPFVSQNFGAGRLDRIREARTVSTRFALGYGGLMAVAFFACAPWLAAAFTDDPKVAETFVSYTRIVSFGYGLMEVHRYCGFFLTGMYRPISATWLNALRVLVLLIPLSYLGAYGWGVPGVFWGRLATDVVVGVVGIAWVSRVLRSTPSVAGATDVPGFSTGMVLADDRLENPQGVLPPDRRSN
jgi:putative MATE family efflux protein